VARVAGPLGDIVIFKKEEKEENQPEWAFTYLTSILSKPPPPPPPPSLNNLQYPHRKKTHIAYTDNLKQPYEHATAGLSSRAVVSLIFFKQSCRNSKFQKAKKQKTKNKKQKTKNKKQKTKNKKQKTKNKKQKTKNKKQKTKNR